ncbi:uncharacterized protein apol [Lampris incognitus]|uniref:uncharacterized protein apol n=1 Tax=Lampris incognitus TaxID=2546036 RepID=UPI0024B4DB81|nr:uncharacterized protein apol [Lampris incognitus]
MPATRELQEAWWQYITDTFDDIETVNVFCHSLSKWALRREEEVKLMRDINERADKLDLHFSHVIKSKTKATAFTEYAESKLTLITKRRREALKEELATVLKNTLEALEKLNCFLDAVERLAVTSLHVFTERNLVLPTSLRGRFEGVQAIITAARLVCPLLLQFKKDPVPFFQPILQNVEVLAIQLENYIHVTQKICKGVVKKSPINDFCLKMTKRLVCPGVATSDDIVHRMLCHIEQLRDIRMNQHFRLVFLFQQKSPSEFIDKFSQCQPRVLPFLTNLEECAVQLDKMRTGAKISSVAGSSLGAVGGVLSIVGLSLAPVTAGVSLALTLAGVGMGVTSGVNSIVTAVAETAVNSTQQKKANEIFSSFMEDIVSLQECLEAVSNQTDDLLEEKGVVATAMTVLGKTCTIGRGIDSIIDCSSAVKLLKNDDLVTSAAKAAFNEGKALRNTPRVASDIPDIGTAVAKGPLALSKSARVGFIALNALFIGMDIFFIGKDSVDLALGSESEHSLLIRARAALWRSEVDSWQKLHDSLRQGKRTSEMCQNTLETPFNPAREI